MNNPALIAAGNHKGGCGKTTSLCNLGRRAQQRGLKTLVVDTDQQADAFAHFSGCDDPEQGAAHAWADGCHVVWWPDASSVPAIKGYDLVLWDMPPKVYLPPALPVTGVIVPVDGPFSMKNAADFIATVKAPCLLVANGLREGGKAFEATLKASFGKLPPHVMACPIDLLRGGSIRRCADAGMAAWEDMYAGQAGARVLQWCDWVLDEGLPWFRRGKAA